MWSCFGVFWVFLSFVILIKDMVGFNYCILYKSPLTSVMEDLLSYKQTKIKIYKIRFYRFNRSTYLTGPNLFNEYPTWQCFKAIYF